MHSHTEQGFSQRRIQLQDVVLGWSQASILRGEACVVHSQSASSAVISPGSGDCDYSRADSLGQSSSSLKERDYIGLAEVSSAPPLDVPVRACKLNLMEADLRLRLGPSTSDSFIEQKDRIAFACSHAADGSLHNEDEVKRLSSTWQVIPPKGLDDAMAVPHVNVHRSSLQLVMSKNGGKRLYGEAMVDAPRDSKPTTNGNLVLETRSCANSVLAVKQPQFPEVKPFLQGMFRAAPRGAPWQCQTVPHSSSHKPASGQKGTAFSVTAKVEVDGDILRNSKLDLSCPNEKTTLQSSGGREDVHDEAPPAKGQVVGWPPVRSYRRSTLAARSKLIGEEGDGQSTNYVKVNMDGIPIGRKVDLSVYKSYDGLLSALEDMFRSPNGGYGAQFLKGAEFVLTYEDREGDWMLVGDVPWGMFMDAVRRLRITRGPDRAGLGSRPTVSRA